MLLFGITVILGTNATIMFVFLIVWNGYRNVEQSMQTKWMLPLGRVYK